MCNIDGIYLDFMNLFNEVPHLSLLSKLETYNMTGKLQKEFLTSRKWRVTVFSDSSSWSDSDITSRIPQGNVLRLVLFILFKSDIQM